MPPRERRALVTGGAGFIGSHLDDAWSPRRRVTGIDDLIDEYPRGAEGGRT